MSRYSLNGFSKRRSNSASRTRAVPLQECNNMQQWCEKMPNFWYAFPTDVMMMTMHEQWLPPCLPYKYGHRQETGRERDRIILRGAVWKIMHNMWKLSPLNKLCFQYIPPKQNSHEQIKILEGRGYEAVYVNYSVLHADSNEWTSDFCHLS